MLRTSASAFGSLSSLERVRVRDFLSLCVPSEFFLHKALRNAVSPLRVSDCPSHNGINACLVLFISGAAALIYQVIWIKQLSLVIGVEVYAITTGISAFFAGLALGGLLFGRFADRLGKPLLLYAGLEIGVALLGVGATLGLSMAAAPFAWLDRQIGLLA